MSRLRAANFIPGVVSAPPEVLATTEAAAKRRLSGVEFAMVKKLFELTIDIYDNVECEPNACEVRDRLLKVAKTGRFSDRVATGRKRFAVNFADAFGRYTVRRAERVHVEAFQTIFSLAFHESDSIETLADNFCRRAQHIVAGRGGQADAAGLRRAFDNALDDAALIVRAQEAAWDKTKELVRIELERHGTEPSCASPDSIQSAAKAAEQALTVAIKGGRERRPYDDPLLCGWAHLAELIGITPSASYKPHKRRPDTPFLRWLTAMATLMPDRTRLAFTTDLGGRSKKALKLYRRLIAEGKSGVFPLYRDPNIHANLPRVGG